LFCFCTSFLKLDTDTSYNHRNMAAIARIPQPPVPNNYSKAPPSVAGAIPTGEEEARLLVYVETLVLLQRADPALVTLEELATWRVYGRMITAASCKLILLDVCICVRAYT
jgi:hypothetical protein